MEDILSRDLVSSHVLFRIYVLFLDVTDLCFMTNNKPTTASDIVLWIFSGFSPLMCFDLPSVIMDKMKH